jgi:hypothetical protein
MAAILSASRLTTFVGEKAGAWCQTLSEAGWCAK